MKIYSRFSLQGFRSAVTSVLNFADGINSLGNLICMSLDTVDEGIKCYIRALKAATGDRFHALNSLGNARG